LSGKVGGNHREGKNFYSKPRLRLVNISMITLQDGHEGDGGGFPTPGASRGRLPRIMIRASAVHFRPSPPIHSLVFG